MAVSFVVLVCILLDLALVEYAATLERDDPVAHYKQGLDYFARDELGMALKELNTAIACDRNRPDPYILRGTVYVRLKRWEEAADSYRTGIEMGHPDPRYRTNYLWCLIELERYEEAVAFGERSLDEGVSDPNVIRTTAVAASHMGDPKRARMHLEAALNEFPSDMWIMDSLLKLYRESGLQDEVADMESRMERAREGLAEMNGPVPE
ncbi:MAG: tetratricopeptide repeat protein [bacterium]|nr:tetratricopeptide repeat protein [bacterium]